VYVEREDVVPVAQLDGLAVRILEIDEVRREVKEAIRKAGCGGGYICMSSNSIHSGVRPAKVRILFMRTS